MARPGPVGGQYQPLTEAQIRQIHQASLTVLECTGLHVENEEALTLYRQGGARVEGHRVYISPAMVEEFIKPAYDRWVPEFKAAGVPVVVMDSDGRLDELIPIWLESGFNVCYPIEVAAGCDINAYRSLYGKRLGFIGGVDKRAIARGGRIIEQELARIEPVIRDGGFVPGCDHGVPPDISWPGFVDYARVLARLTGWL